MRNVLEPTDLTVAEIDGILDLALDMIARPEAYSDVCRGKKLATLFYEPSTRTRLSFTSAMMSLGGDVLGFSDANSTSVNKGETVADTTRVVANFVDIIAMRHHKEGAPLVASLYADVPIINAGDGGHSHPTQTLTDMLTIRREKGRLDHLTIGLCGDLKYGRTVHSLIKAFGRYEGIKFVLIAPDELRLPEYMKHDVIDKNGLTYEEFDTLEAALPTLDVLYMTRIQKERFDSEAEYNRLKDRFVLNVEKMALGKSDMIVLHPLPRVNEITLEVDDDPRAAYFRQVGNGRYVRMALIYTLLQWNGREARHNEPDSHWIRGERCTNHHCICAAKEALPYYHIAEKGIKRCVYCEAEMK